MVTDAIESKAGDAHPSLYADRSFLGLTGALFLGAFNDNLFKQLVMLLFVAVPVAGGATRDFQWLAIAVFSVPFVLFSGFAGFISDRNSKRTVIVLCKVAEIAIMASGVIAFFRFDQLGGSLTTGIMAALSVILFCMGAQSAFFGPGKYGILPELFRNRDLPAANGMILMATFVSIILGSAAAGYLKDAFDSRLWVPGLVCVCIAVAGTLTSLLVRITRPADTDLPFEISALTIPHDIRRLLRDDGALSMALFVSCVFWTTAAIVQPSVNALGKLQLQLANDGHVSLLVATISLGIAVGAAICGFLSRGKLDWRLLRVGAAGLVTCLFILSPAPGGQHLLGFAGSMVILTLLGVFTGMFAVPLQVFLQSRPPDELKGRMIATQNLLNWVGIVLSAFIYKLFNVIIDVTGWPQSTMFAMTALLMLPVALLYRPTAQVDFD